MSNAATLNKTETQCYHCGELVVDQSIHTEDKTFCCHGCQTVYELLSANDLCDYYSLESSPGTQLKDFFSEKYRFLENEEIADLLLDFKSENFQKVTFYISSIHCSSCIWLLENLQRFDEGIISSKINFSKKKLSINLNPASTSLKKVVDLLCQLGYEPEINLEQKPERLSRSTAPLLKLGIAGFVFGNIMLLYFPEYLGLDVSSAFQKYFAYISLLLSVPVVAYCASSFYLSAFSALSKKILNIDLPITLGIVTLFTRSAYEIISATGPGYLDSLAGLVFFLLIGRWFQEKTYEGMSFERNYKSYFPLAVSRVRNGVEESTLVENLAVDDTLHIHDSEIIPCDSVLLDDIAQVDYSFVTGESDPIAIKQGDHVYAGGRLIGASASFQVKKSVSSSYLTQLWNDPDSSTEEKSGQFNSLIDKVSRYFTPAILAIAVLSGLVWIAIDSSQALLVFSSVLIIACPCALALATPFTLNAVMNSLGSHKMYLKGTHVIEELWQIGKIVFDKTGTLTKPNSTNIMLKGALDEHEKALVGYAAAQSTHPLSRAIAKEWRNTAQYEITDFISYEGLGIEAIVDGKKVQIGSSEFVAKSKSTPANKSTVHICIDGEYKGYLIIGSQLRTGIKASITSLSHDYNLALLSGDNDGEKHCLGDIFPEASELKFNQSPTDKLAYIKSEVKQTPTLMVGDGLNDAGALHASSVGMSVTDDMASFTPASKVIIHGTTLSQLHKLLSLVLKARQIIILGFSLSLLYNLIGISFAVIGWVSPIFAAILMPVSSISVVLISTLSVRIVERKLKIQTQ